MGVGKTFLLLSLLPGHGITSAFPVDRFDQEGRNKQYWCNQPYATIGMWLLRRAGEDGPPHVWLEWADETLDGGAHMEPILPEGYVQGCCRWP
ncbi:uncharacterized protein K460DRAFT_368436 [Cucurbitaria berberidis CBS 394.84]|uniref:SNF2 N-terminal domain-containing protein n=1 Tax=Cucurbitaria berberidis CBS 394.84 TaxID=1168544 RepID=A0A9P4GE26_9PLEO|nr:uncharacterized protein K460DRAFT_368436 [Cucurbitaria berberidis CBS 394.84]KAF1843549.1 hypothetical protein K460DRAFT_368436 [Cucurbitaria berberidis CBS 394.84]